MKSASNRPSNSTWLALGAAALMGLAGLASNALAQTSGGTDPFTAHWAVISKSGTTWKDEITLPGVDMKKDVQVFYEHQFGTYPIAGPHLIPDDDSNFMSVHLAKVRKDIAYKFPDPNATGLGVIDYESWLPFWTMHPETVYTTTGTGDKINIKEAWRDHIRQTQPQLLAGKNAAAQEEVFKTTWLAKTRTFYERTIKECQRLRPNVKWGVFGMPMRSYYMQFDAKKYADFQKCNDAELTWLWDLQDVFFADIYTFFYSVEGRRPDPKKSEDAATDHAGYVRSNVREAVRVAKGKPVYSFVTTCYHESTINKGKFINDINIRQMIELSKTEGANGVIMWDWIDNPEYFGQVKDFMANRMAPALAKYTAVASNTSNNNGASGGGSNSGGGNGSAGNNSNGSSGSGNAGAGSGAGGSSGSSGSGSSGSGASSGNGSGAGAGSGSGSGSGTGGDNQGNRNAGGGGSGSGGSGGSSGSGASAGNNSNGSAGSGSSGSNASSGATPRFGRNAARGYTDRRAVTKAKAPITSAKSPVVTKPKGVRVYRSVIVQAPTNNP